MLKESDYNIDTQIFLQKCRPKLRQLETLRVEKLGVYNVRKKLAKIITPIATPICGFIDYWLFLLQRGNEDTLMGVTFLFAGALYAWVTKPKRQYARAYKTDMLPDIARAFGDFRYKIKGKISMADMKPSNIVPHHTSYNSEDYFAGDFKGVGIRFSEIMLSKKSGKRTVTVFRGLAILLDQGVRKFHGKTILTMDKTKPGEWFQKRITKLKPANLVDPEFENLFDVFTNDQVEARYLIDPVIVENLKALYREHSGDQMLASFYDNKFLILIGSNKNHFEPADIYTSATNEGELLALKSEVSQILSIVNRLSLYDPTQRRRLEAKAS